MASLLREQNVRLMLEFERPLVELECKIEDLQQLQSEEADFSEEIERLQKRANQLLEEIYADLSPWQVVQLSRHPARPYMMDYVEELITDFTELHGDRLYRDDPAIIGGMGTFQQQPVMVIGHQKGRNTRQNMRRNFGMPRPEGYRKARRLMELAGRFKLPVITLIDTPGAYPGIGAEERGQAEAIARNLELMAALPVPMISVVIGEGGSGGALALGVTNRILMLQYSIYSVISPEGCASILWKDGAMADRAAGVMRLQAHNILELGVADEVIAEPPGGAHRDPLAIARELGRVLGRHLEQLNTLTAEQIVQQRYDKFRKIGVFVEHQG